MNPLVKAALSVVGLVYLVFNVVLRLFVFVCAIFSIFIMLGLMIEWTQQAFTNKGATS